MRRLRAPAEKGLHRSSWDLRRNAPGPIQLEVPAFQPPWSSAPLGPLVAPGEYVNEKPLLRIAQMDPLRVEAVAPASAFGSVREGMLAEVITENAAGRTLTAKVRIVDRLIDPASGTFGIRLELPNPDYRLPGGLKCMVRFLDETDTASPAKLSADREEADKIAARLQPKPLLISSME